MENKGARFLDRENVISEIIFHTLVKDNKKVIRNFHGKSKLFTYLWPIVRNKLVDLIRAEHRYHSVLDNHENLDEIAIEDNPSTGSVEEIFEAHLQDEKPLDKFIKYAKWLQELSYNDIISRAREEFPHSKLLNTQRIAYVLHTNRKELQKNLKNRILESSNRLKCRKNKFNLSHTDSKSWSFCIERK